VKLQEEYKDTGFAIVAPHVQEPNKEAVLGLLRKNRANYTVTNGGRAPGQGNGIPEAFLFDTRGKLVEKGHPAELKKKIIDLIQSEPHFLAAGRTYTKLAPVAEALKKTRAYGPILKKLDGDAKKTGDVADEAKYLADRIRAYGKKRLDAAKALETEDPFKAQQAYTEIAASWKGDESGTAAAARLKELKADKEFKKELEASTILNAIITECEKLVASPNGIDPDSSANRKAAATIRGLAATLKRKHPESKAAGKLSELGKSYGFSEL